MLNKNVISKFILEDFGEKMAWDVASGPPIYRLLRNGTITFNFHKK